MKSWKKKMQDWCLKMLGWNHSMVKQSLWKLNQMLWKGCTLLSLPYSLMDLCRRDRDTSLLSLWWCFYKWCWFCCQPLVTKSTANKWNCLPPWLHKIRPWPSNPSSKQMHHYPRKKSLWKQNNILPSWGQHWYPELACQGRPWDWRTRILAAC